MTVEAIENGWFEPLPLQKYQDLVIKSIPENLSGCPPDKTVGNPAVQVACGPNLRFLGCLENGQTNYRGTILLVLRDTPETERIEPSIEYYIGPATTSTGSLQLSKGEFPGTLFHQEQGLSFWRFSMELQLQEYEQKIKYSLNGEYNENFQFYLPSVEQSMNVMSYSCNGFSLSVKTADFKSSLWYDVMRKHSELPYHVMVGGGDQIYCDSVKKSSKPFEKWLKHKKLHSYDKLTDEIVDSLKEYYLTNYIQWFGKGYWEGLAGATLQCIYPLALQQIPQINIFDDHDIIDGFGSYSHRTMTQDIFKGVGNIAFQYYLLFQHHTSPTEDYKSEPSWILGASVGPYIKQLSRSLYTRLGKEVALVGLDCRTERTKKQVVTKETYARVFERLKQEITASNGDIKHLLVLLGVPICYPRMVWIESFLGSAVLGPIKWLARKGIIAKGLVNEFDGGVELLDDLNDHWCAVHHKKERNWLMGELTKFAAAHGVRITILSGDVHLGCLSRMMTKMHKHHIFSSRIDENRKEILEHPEHDPRLIFNVISSAIVNTPPPNGMATLLEKRSKIHHFDSNCDEDVVDLFVRDTDGSARANHLFLNKRNYADLIPFKNLKNTERYNKFRPGELIHPGPSEALEKAESAGDGGFSTKKIGYPLDPNSLVTTFHFEVDMRDTNSRTYDYEVLIPQLEGTYDLKDVGLK
ncbi:hypothetical protein KL936_003065 [Ogataea polymorpha]|nr:hypothetical protein KL936_003065 [Ogataea polymorpha]